MHKYQSWAQQGSTLITSGVASTDKALKVYGGATITVYSPGTTTALSIYSDNGVTPLANPFTSNSDGSFAFYAAENPVDVRVSGTGVATPFTLSGVGPGIISLASVSIYGAVRLSKAPVSAADPIAIGPNDYRVSDGIKVYASATAGAGTSGSPFTGWDTAITWTAGAVYDFGGYYYSYATAPNWNKTGMKLLGNGATLVHTGSGVAVKMENTSGNTENLTMENFRVTGNSNTTNGLSLKSVHRSRFKNISLANIPGKILHTQFAITNYFDVSYSINSEYTTNGDVFPTINPQYGYYLTSRGGGEPTQDCTFMCPIIEGVSINAAYLDGANGNLFLGGVFEANSGGVKITNGSRNNIFLGQDFESNAYNLTTHTVGEGVDVLIDSGTSNSNWIHPTEALGTINLTAGNSTRISGMMVNLTIGVGANSTFLDNPEITGTFTNSSASTTNSGVSTPSVFTIGSWKLTGSLANGLLAQPTANGAGVLEVSPKGGSQPAVLNLFASDRVADAVNIGGGTFYANSGGPVRLFSWGVGTFTRQPLQFFADSATYNSPGATPQLLLPTTGGVQLNLLMQTEGAVLSVSSNTIAPTNSIHHVGAGLIKTITVPTGFTAGTISLIPDSAFTYDTTDNIAAGGGGTATIGRVMTFTRSSSSSKWYASY